MPEVSIKCDWSCGYETVTAPGRSHPQSRSRRFIRAPTALEVRLIRNPADQPEHGHGNMVNGSLTSLLMAVLRTYFGLLTVW